MVRYYGRARQRIGSVNTNQMGLKMSGCPSKVGLNPTNNRYIQQRVNCANGRCGIPIVNGAIWRHNFRNKKPYCKDPSSKCLAAAGGIRNIYTPYYKTIQPGKYGCGRRFNNLQPLPSLVFIAGAAGVGADTTTGYVAVESEAIQGIGVVTPIGTPIGGGGDGVVVGFATNGSSPDTAIIVASVPVLKDGQSIRVEEEIDGKKIVEDTKIQNVSDDGKVGTVALSEPLREGEKVSLTLDPRDIGNEANRSAAQRAAAVAATMAL